MQILRPSFTNREITYDNYFLGIDVSTTATKASLIDGKGKVIAVATSEYPFEIPNPLWSE
jgi:xylulokinase